MTSSCSGAISTSSAAGLGPSRRSSRRSGGSVRRPNGGSTTCSWAALAGLLQVPAERVALVSSTTNGCNIVLAGLDLGPDDEVVTTDVEHFGLLGPLFASPARVKVASVRDAPAEEAPQLVLAAVTPK